MKTWLIRFGRCAFRFYAEHHADQFARALSANGTPYTVTPETVAQPTGIVVGASWRKQ